MPEQSMTRRGALHRLLAAALGAAVIGTPFGRTAFAATPAAAMPLLALPLRSSSARAIGEAYLARFGEERSMPLLLAALSDCMTKDGRRLDGIALAKRIRRDFDRGDVVRLDGWFLSRTECRFCALYAL